MIIMRIYRALFQGFSHRALHKSHIDIVKASLEELGPHHWVQNSLMIWVSLGVRSCSWAYIWKTNKGKGIRSILH